MDEIRWIKIVTNVFDNRKIKMIEAMPEGDAILIVWFKILTLAGQINDGGLVYFTKDIPYTEQLLATQFNRPISIIQLALVTFERLGMIEVTDNLIMVSNWEKYQNVDGMEKVREQNRIRQSKYREKQKLLASNVTGNVTVTLSNGAEKEIEKENKNIPPNILTDIAPQKGASIPERKKIPPTLDMVRAYCKSRGNNVNPEEWMDHYDSNGWMVGRNHMKDWQAAVRTWEHDKNRTQQKPKKPPVKQENDPKLKKIFGVGGN